MPGGIDHPVLGYATFCAIKLVGYSAAGWVLSRAYKRPDRNPIIVGVVRTLIGMAAGAAYAWLAFSIGASYRGTALPDYAGWVYMAGLLPIRIAEWWLLIWLFYDRRFEQPAKGWKMVALGTVWSYVLDLPAAVGFIATAGFWVC
jgi:hypothetical protein